MKRKNVTILEGFNKRLSLKQKNRRVSSKDIYLFMLKTMKKMSLIKNSFQLLKLKALVVSETINFTCKWNQVKNKSKLYQLFHKQKSLIFRLIQSKTSLKVKMNLEMTV